MKSIVYPREPASDALFPQTQLITDFGTARLVENQEGQLELHGGTPSDRQSAYEWISLFWHEAVVREVLV